MPMLPYARLASGFAALLLVAGGCDVAPDPLATATLEAKGGSGKGKGGSGGGKARPSRHANGERRHGSGSKGAKGLATLSARALLGQDGTTELDLSANGNIRLVLVRAVTDGTRADDWSHDGHAAIVKRVSAAHVVLAIHGLNRGQQLRVTALVRATGSRREEVVRVVETVKLRPNLVASNLVLPPSAQRNAVVTISATVSETNGDAGAGADCVLYDGGTAVDRAHGIFVGAGQTVSCAFEHLFAAAGSHDIKVAAENVDPADWDVSDNAVSGSIDIISSLPLAYTAAFSDITTTFAGHQEGSVASPDGSTHVFSYDTSSVARNQSASLAGGAAVGVSFPLAHLRVSESADGAAPIQSISADGVPFDTFDLTTDGVFDYAVSCANLSDSTGTAFLQVCNTLAAEIATGVRSESTGISYNRFAGEVTFHSEGFDRYTYSDGTGEDFTFNDTGTKGSPPAYTATSSFGFDLLVDDGTRSFVASPVVPLAPVSTSDSQPLACDDWTDPDGTTSHFCSSFSSASVGYAGLVTAP